MTAGFDAIVIGAGHNGLAAAELLAAKGKRVCIVERAETVGGMAAGGTLSGVTVPRLAHLLYGFKGDPGVALERLPTIGLSPDGRHIMVSNGKLSFADGGAHPDAAAFDGLHARLVRFAGLLDGLADAPPPALAEGLADMTGLARLGLRTKRLGKTDMREFLRIMLSNVYDLLLDDMADGPAAGVLAADAVRGAFAGPRSPGSVMSLMYRLRGGGDAHLPMGGMGAVMKARAEAARARGVTFRLGKGVAHVDVEGTRAVGVTLDDGTVLRAAAVLSSLGAAQTMQLAGPAQYDIEAVRRLRNLRAKGTVAKLNLILNDLPQMPGLSEDQRGGRLVLAPSATYVEDAFNPAKYGGNSASPVLEAVMPSQRDTSLGGHVLSVNVQYMTHTQGLKDAVLGALKPYMPDLPDLITKAEVLGPDEIEDLTGSAHWHHAEMGIDQLLTVRPVNGMARYAFGPEGYFLCGASAHPGGDVTGQPGRNAAAVVLKSGVMG
ncbi:MAG: NAD(P)/FAD-dependent oxidoreductase [Sulfitobacter sp.]|nr:NAD(P)/FAD-dependent oxidoreductase [Sulfitobacter sp.]